MRSMSVVMPGVAAKDPVEVAFVQNQKVVETLRAHRTHEPFGVRVRIRGSERSLEDTRSLGAKDVIEASAVSRY